MNSKIIKLFLSLLLGVVLFAGSTFAEEGDGKKKSNTFNKPMADPIRAYMNINFVSTIIKNDGVSDINIGQDASGLIYPKGSGKTAVYTSGLLWGANVNDPAELDPHIGGTVYRTGLQPGWIDASGNVITTYYYPLSGGTLTGPMLADSNTITGLGYIDFKPDGVVNLIDFSINVKMLTHH